MAATMMEAAKAPQPELAAPQCPTAALLQTKEAFAREERHHAGDEFAFRLWVIGYLVMWLLALSDWLRAILGW